MRGREGEHKIASRREKERRLREREREAREEKGVDRATSGFFEYLAVRLRISGIGGDQGRNLARIKVVVIVLLDLTYYVK